MHLTKPTLAAASSLTVLSREWHLRKCSASFAPFKHGMAHSGHGTITGGCLGGPGGVLDCNFNRGLVSDLDDVALVIAGISVGIDDEDDDALLLVLLLT